MGIAVTCVFFTWDEKTPFEMDKVSGVDSLAASNRGIISKGKSFRDEKSRSYKSAKHSVIRGSLY